MKKEVVCPRCGATNVGPQTECLICRAGLPAASAQPWAPPPGGSARPSAPPARLTLVRGTGSPPYVDLPPGGLTIGRSTTNGLVLATDSQVSRHHANLEYAGGQWVLTDAGSRNGTFVNGMQVTRQVLRRGDQIQIGDLTWVFQTRS